LREPVAVSVGDDDVGVVHEPVDGRGRDRGGSSWSNPSGWMFELIAMDRRS
jgi:hypothetical protein